MKQLSGPVLALLLVPGAAFAEDDGNCYNPLKLSEGFNPTLATVSSTEPKTFFRRNRSSDKSCPSEGATCRSKAYLVPNDQIFAGLAQGDYLCVAKVSPKGRVTTGWLRKGDVAPVQTPAITTADWLGTWTAPEQKIVITRGKRAGPLSFDASATFGALDPERVKRGAVNMGDFAAEWKPEGAFLAFAIGDKGAVSLDKGEEYSCKVHMLRVGPSLIVEDNGTCGGLNVSFTGVYAKKK